MKKVIIVSKTHMDLGFTDFAEQIERRYIEEFIPNSIDIAKKLNADGKRFVWTTGSWILKEALEQGSQESREKLTAALKRGDIASHGMPFTTHTELLDADTVEYGISITRKIDEIVGRKTIACKFTDIPGHTAAIVPILAKHGFRLLHIGVNGASAIPDVPPCFLWKYGGAEIVVIYSASYGGAFQSEFLDDILYFDHSMDNCGPRSAERALENFEVIKKKYPDYAVSAGRLDDYAELIWRVKDSLPVLECEIGDTWIHGAATDPFKAGALRTLIRLKHKWLKEGSIRRDSAEYRTLSDGILCLGEHTCGMDMKTHLADFEHYLRKDFERARAADIVSEERGYTIKNLPYDVRDFDKLPDIADEMERAGIDSEVAVLNLWDAHGAACGEVRNGSYSKIEKSWAEQRGYILRALSGLSDSRREEAEAELSRLIPKESTEKGGHTLVPEEERTHGAWRLKVNHYGGLGGVWYRGNQILSENTAPLLTYNAYGCQDYDYWVENYMRDYRASRFWSAADFTRPLLKDVDSEYKKGGFPYRLCQLTRAEKGAALHIYAELSADSYCYENLGAPKRIQVEYIFERDTLKINVDWFDKPSNRLPESTVLRLFPHLDHGSLAYRKLSREIDPTTVVKKGARNLAATESARFLASGRTVEIVNYHAPLTALGEGKILQFDNVIENVGEKGLSYILHNNIWGTNFPLWYGENAHFQFAIKPIFE